jgi:hypothetical protein
MHVTALNEMVRLGMGVFSWCLDCFVGDRRSSSFVFELVPMIPFGRHSARIIKQQPTKLSVTVDTCDGFPLPLKAQT